jgi:beta-glucanase (GH16 family)
MQGIWRFKPRLRRENAKNFARAGCARGALGILIFLGLAFVSGTKPSAKPLASAGKQRGCELRKVLLEDFATLSIASSKLGSARWTAHTPWSGDFGDAVFIDPGPDGPFAIENNMLAITASKNKTGRWQSGLIASADSSGAGVGVRYGYFDVRMKMPPGPGTWPAFWLAALKPVEGSDGNVEIDVVEYYGQFTSSYRAAVHIWYKDTTKTRASGELIEVPNDSLVNDYHNYGVDISPQAIVIFFDGRQVWSYPTPPELTSRMYPLVNLALGSGWPIENTPNPSKLLVDYVHVYERGPGPATGGCLPGLHRH